MYDQVEGMRVFFVGRLTKELSVLPWHSAVTSTQVSSNRDWLRLLEFIISWSLTIYSKKKKDNGTCLKRRNTSKVWNSTDQVFFTFWQANTLVFGADRPNNFTTFVALTLSFDVDFFNTCVAFCNIQLHHNFLGIINYFHVNNKKTHVRGRLSRILLLCCFPHDAQGKPSSNQTLPSGKHLRSCWRENANPTTPCHFRWRIVWKRNASLYS